MTEKSESLKDEMSEALRADRERARDRKPPELPQPEAVAPVKRSFLQKLFR